MEEIKPLDPKKRTVKKVFREYGKKEDVVKPEKKPFYQDFPEKTKEFLVNVKEFLIKHEGIITIIVLAILIFLFLVLIFIPKTPKASFVDNGEYIYGYVYFDDVLLGDTDGIKFKGFPKEYCKGVHIVKLESANNAYEWQTYPGDCKVKHITFNINHEKQQPSKNIVLKFLDRTGSYHINGNLFFDGVFEQEATSAIALDREKCMNITTIKFEYSGVYIEEVINPEICNSSNEIIYRVS